jgi:hypothetical protein
MSPQNVQLNKSQIKLIVFLLTTVIGLLFSLYDYLDYREGRSSIAWLPAEGKIITNSIRTQTTWKNTLSFIPSATYSYHISESEILRGERISFPDHVAAPEHDLKKLLQRLNVGQPVTSYYDPHNHSRVTLIRGVRRAKYCALFVRDAFISILGAFLALSSLKPGREKV